MINKMCVHNTFRASAFFLIVSLLVLRITINVSLATDVPSNAKQALAPKYSKFFEEKPHWCDALVITCVDFRFTSATQEFVNERLGLKGNYDYISIPGSIKNLLDSKTRDLVLNKFGISVRLHHVKRLIILGHQDCTIGYGGSTSFNDAADEYNTISKDLKKARFLLGLKFSHLKVYLYYSTVLYKDHQRIYNFKQIL